MPFDILSLRNEMNDRSIYPLGKKRTLVVLAGTLLGMFLASINQTLAATALPRVVGDLGGLGHYCVAKAMTYAAASFVAMRPR